VQMPESAQERIVREWPKRHRSRGRGLSEVAGLWFDVIHKAWSGPNMRRGKYYQSDESEH